MTKPRDQFGAIVRRKLFFTERGVQRLIVRDYRVLQDRPHNPRVRSRLEMLLQD